MDLSEIENQIKSLSIEKSKYLDLMKENNPNNHYEYFKKWFELYEKRLELQDEKRKLITNYRQL